MTKEQLFDIWAPASSPWSLWAKPVLFAAYGPGAMDGPAGEPVDVGWAPSADGRSVVVVDMPGAASVAYGVALAAIGYRPVPLYNAIPDPRPAPAFADRLQQSSAAVDLQPILRALEQGAERLARFALRDDAPPAFLLDARRSVAQRPLEQGVFDNRSVSFPTDFPSANLLLSRGYQSVLLIQEEQAAPRNDLAHTLRRWQDAGLTPTLRAVAGEIGPAPITIVRPRWYGRLWYGLRVAAGLTPAVLGGYGGVISEDAWSG